MSVIIVDNVSKRFRIPKEKRSTLFQNLVGVVKRQLEYEEFWALQDVSFQVEKGETFGIIGRNGSGKTTLLKILAKVLYPDRGAVTINGRVASFLELGVGFQPELTARENVYIYASILGMGKKQVDKVHDDIFEFAELKKFQDMKLKNYSSGMYLRLAFSTAIHAHPDIMLVDEVLAVGDEAFQKKCLAKIEEFRRQGRTIVLVSHNLGTVKQLCQRSLLLDNCISVAPATTDKVVTDYLKLLQGTT